MCGLAQHLILGLTLILLDSVIVILASLLEAPGQASSRAHRPTRWSSSFYLQGTCELPSRASISTSRGESQPVFCVASSVAPSQTPLTTGTQPQIYGNGGGAVIWHIKSSHQRQHDQTGGIDLIDVEWQRIEGDNLDKGLVRKNRGARFYEERVSANR